MISAIQASPELGNFVILLENQAPLVENLVPVNLSDLNLQSNISQQ
jgi:hypothetical protein